jgi:transposase
LCQETPDREVSLSTSLLSHAFGTRGSRDLPTTYTEGRIVRTIRQGPRSCRCAACGSGDVVSRGHGERRPRSLPIGPRATSLVLPIPRVECRACGVVRQVDVTFAEARRSSTKAFARYVLELSRRITPRDVAAPLGVGWDLVQEVQKRDRSRRYGRPQRKHLRRIASDEIAVAKGHRSLSVVLDLDSGAVVFVGDGKGADALKPFWTRLRPSGAKVAAVALAMAAAYRGAVSTHLTGAVIVCDPFPVIKPFNDKLSDLRRSLDHRAEADGKQVLKGAWWLLLKDPEDLDAGRDERRRLEEARALDQPLATAYSLKEDLRRSWEQPGKRFATAFLKGWRRRAEASGVKGRQPMAKTLAAHRTGLCWRTPMRGSRVARWRGRTTRSRR